MIKWSQLRLTTRFRFVVVAFGVLMIVPAFLAFYASNNASRQLQRSGIIGQVVRNYEGLEDVAHQLNHFAENGASLTSPEALKLRDEIAGHAGMIRLAISEEVALVGATGAAEEAEEIELIDAIERNINDAAEGRAPARWSTLIQQGIAEENQELSTISRVVRVNGIKIRAIMLWEMILASLLAAGLIWWATRRVMIPLRQLADGATEIGEGNHEHRIAPNGDPDLRAVIQSFNQMADQLAAQRCTIASANQQLAQTVDERTAALELANLKLGDLMSKRSAFLADISHELRTPIAIIRGEADVVLRNRQSTHEDLAESLRRIAGQSDTLANLVNDLLYVARNESGAPTTKSVKTNLLFLAKSAAEDVRSMLVADGGSIDFESGEKQAFILGDPGRIAQLLRILVDNAIQYSSGPPVIHIGLARSTEGFYLAVSDQGYGIAPSDLPEIFERYRRGSNAAETNGNGHGLGLPLAKAIVEAHGGTISIESENGKGTTVHVFFPDAKPLRAIA